MSARGKPPSVQELLDDALAVQEAAAGQGERPKYGGPDFSAQLKAIELRAKLCGLLERTQDAEELVKTLQRAGYVVRRMERAG